MAVVWRILAIDDEEEVCTEIKEFLEGERIAREDDACKVESLTNFPAALAKLEAERFDLVILDVRVGSQEVAVPDPGAEAGRELLEQIKARRFVPVVFYTALPNQVRDLEGDLVRVVTKGGASLGNLLEAVRAVFASGLPDVNRALLRHVEYVQRDWMWKFVVPNWAQLAVSEDRRSLAYLLARRLAMSLSVDGIDALVAGLGGAAATAESRGVHPVQYYLLPPVMETHMAGDLLREGENAYYVVLTPACDLVQGKAEHVLLAKCLDLRSQPEYKNWREQASGTTRDKLLRLLKNNREPGQKERFHFLPGAMTIPGLVVDFQQLVTVPFAEIGGRFARLASLDSPFAEALLARFGLYFGRLGTPDLDFDQILASLQGEQQ